MRIVNKIFYIALLAIMAISCAEDNLQKEKVQFAVDLKAATGSDNGRVKSASEIPAGAKLFVSIQTSAGSPVFTFHEVEMLTLGGSVITSPLELLPGSYELTDFLIVHDDEILFATPRRGSTMAAFVSNPLNVSFSVSSGGVKNIAMELLDVTASAPSAFGYASFNINVVHPLQIAVMTPTASGFQFLAAKATIYKGNDVAQEINLGAWLNRTSFKLDPDETYTLQITRSGYTAFRRDFNYNDLMDELNGAPLKAILQPAVTIVPRTDIYLNFSFYMTAVEPTTITVDWGDGTVETFETEDNSLWMHTYAHVGNYHIAATGPLDKIDSFYAFYSDANYSEVNVDHLVNMYDFRTGLNTGPRVIDLSKNTKLTSLMITSTKFTEKVILPQFPGGDLRLDFSGPNLINTATVNGIIDHLHNYAVSTGSSGILDLADFWYQPDPNIPLNFIGPPSAPQMAKLYELRDNYGWDIHPELP